MQCHGKIAKKCSVKIKKANCRTIPLVGFHLFMLEKNTYASKCTDKESMPSDTVVISWEELSIVGLDFHNFYAFIFFMYFHCQALFQYI